MSERESESGGGVGSSVGLGRVIVFAIYSILYEAIIWGIFGYAVFVKDRSGWWVLVAIMCSEAQLKPKHFDIPEAKRPNACVSHPGTDAHK